MWKEKLEILKKEMELYQEKINSGIVDKEILKFQREVRKEFGYELPPDYLKFLKYINGFEYNGFILYQVDEYLTNYTPVNQHVS